MTLARKAGDPAIVDKLELLIDRVGSGLNIQQGDPAVFIRQLEHGNRKNTETDRWLGILTVLRCILAELQGEKLKRKPSITNAKDLKDALKQAVK